MTATRVDRSDAVPATAALAPPASAPSGRRERSNLGFHPLQLLPFLILGVVSLAGVPYYILPPAARVRSAFHPWLRPSGFIGQTAGLLTFAGFLFMWLYPMRKKLRKATWPGPVPKWLDVHIAVGITLPIVGAIHAGWRFNGLIGLGYLAMLVVCCSGFVGRYLYVRIPRGRAGLELTRDEVAAQGRTLLGELVEASGMSPEDLQQILAVHALARQRKGLLGALRQMVADDVARDRAVRALRRRWEAGAAAGGRHDPAHLDRVLLLARREIALNQHLRLLEATQAMFRYWHAAHKPVAIAAFGAVTIHVVVVVAAGATWFW